MVKQSFELLEREGEPVVEIVGSEDAGIEVTLAHGAEVLGAAIVFCETDGLEILREVIRGAAVEVVDAVRILRNRSHESHIDGMGSEDVTMMSERIFELQIPLFSAGICFVLRVRVSSGFWFQKGRDTMDNTASFRTVPFDPKDGIIAIRIWYNFVLSRLEPDARRNGT